MQGRYTNQGQQPVSVGYTDVAAGASVAVTGLNSAQAANAQTKASRTFLVQLTLGPEDQPPVKALQATPGNPGGGAHVLAGVGFTLKDSTGTTVTIAEPVGLAVFDDAACTVPSVTAYFDTPTAGTIQKGSGTNAIEATTSGGGVLTCSVHKPAVGDVWIKSFSLPSATRILDSSDVHKVTFS